MLVGGRSSISCLEELSLDCSWPFHFVTYICLSLWGVQLCLYSPTIAFLSGYIDYYIVQVIHLFILFSFLFGFSSFFFIPYFEFQCNKHGRHQLQCAYLFCCAVWQFCFWIRDQFLWASCEEASKVCSDSDGFSHERNYGEYESHIFTGEVCTALLSVRESESLAFREL